MGNDMERPLPCPVCGFKSVLVPHEEDEGFYVCCGDPDCWAECEGSTPANALKRWNTRITPTPAQPVEATVTQKGLPADEQWYGYAGHLIVSKRCAYHLCTRINGYLISTVGAFYPSSDAEMETIGGGKEDFYETFVFDCAGNDENGDPIINFSEIDSKRYAKSIDAEHGHYEFLAKYRVPITRKADCHEELEALLRQLNGLLGMTSESYKALARNYTPGLHDVIVKLAARATNHQCTEKVGDV